MSASGDKAAVAYLASVAAMLLIAGVALSATNQAWRDQNPDQQPKTTAGYCDAKLGAIGYKKSPDKEPEPDSEEQKRRYDVCLQIRSAEAAERSAETGDNQWNKRHAWASLSSSEPVSVPYRFTPPHAARRRSISHFAVWRQSASMSWRPVANHLR